MAARIVNNFDFPIIADDNRNPQTSWENHVRRGSLGGVDLAYPYGSAVRANADGILWWHKANGSAGWYAQLRVEGRPGWIIEYYHMSDFQLPPNVNGVQIREGQLVGLSGASGFGESRYYAPHLHVHLYINGVRVNLWNYFTDTAGGGVTPIPDRDEFDMASLDDLRTIIRQENEANNDATGRIDARSQLLVEVARRSEPREEEALAFSRQAAGRKQAYLTGFYKHADNGNWVVVFPSGNFRRVSDQAQAVIYNELNNGVSSLTVSGAALRQIIRDLEAAGGKDLSAIAT